LHTDTGSAVPVAGAARVDDDFAKVRMQRALVGTRVLARPVGAFILVVVGAVLVCPAFGLLSPTASIHTDAGETAPFAGISVEGRSGCVIDYGCTSNAPTSHIESPECGSLR
jgi:hypothetical protein